jgi:ubiquinone/menaquinone biosynthesis C-methylase UbiE
MELQFGDTAAAGYDQDTGRVAAQLIPTLLRAARLAPGMRVLDVATGTGIAAEAALAAVGPTGHVIGVDISPAMIAKARERLGGLANVTLAVEDGQSLTFPDESFDAVLCSMGLMFFPDPARGLSEFHRVLRSGRRAAVAVNTAPERSLMGRVLAVIGRHIPSKAAAAEHHFSVGGEQRLRSLFAAAGFSEVEIATETFRFSFPSFDAYFSGVERGAGNVGQEYMALPEEVRRAVREETRYEVVGDAGGPAEVDVTIRFGSGRR